MSKWQLFSTLTVGCGVESSIRGKVDGLAGCWLGIVQGITREDGSGSSFIVHLLTADGTKQVWVRTID